MAEAQVNERQELAKKAYERMKILAHGLTAREKQRELHADCQNGQILLMPSGKI